MESVLSVADVNRLSKSKLVGIWLSWFMKVLRMQAGSPEGDGLRLLVPDELVEQEYVFENAQ